MNIPLAPFKGGLFHDRSIQKGEIGQHQSCHGLNNGHGSGNDTGIMSSFPFSLYGIAGLIDRFISLYYRSDRFEGHIEVNIHTIANAALNTPAIIGFGGSI